MNGRDRITHGVIAFAHGAGQGGSRGIETIFVSDLVLLLFLRDNRGLPQLYNNSILHIFLNKLNRLAFTSEKLHQKKRISVAKKVICLEE